MKKISIIALGAMALILAIVAGCSKNVLNYGDIQKLNDSEALLKINYESSYAVSRPVFLEINGQRVNPSIAASPFYARTPFPGAGFNTLGATGTGDFLQVPSGDVRLSVVLSRKVDTGIDSTELYSTVLKLDGGKKYVAHITDTSATTKTLLAEVNFTLPDSSFALMHIVNLMPNVPALDLYYGATAITAVDQSTDTLYAANVGYLQASPYFNIKVSTPNKIWKIRAAGAAKNNTTIIASYTGTSVPLNQRSYVAFAIGYNGKTTAAQKPYLSFFYVR